MKIYWLASPHITLLVEVVLGGEWEESKVVPRGCGVAETCGVRTRYATSADAMKSKICSKERTCPCGGDIE